MFHLDEHVSHAIAHALWRRQIDVTTATGAGLLGVADDVHLEFALRERRVIYTNDADFLRLASTGIEHAGIVFCSPASRTLAAVIRHLALMDACMEQNDMLNRIEFC